MERVREDSMNLMRIDLSSTFMPGRAKSSSASDNDGTPLIDWRKTLTRAGRTTTTANLNWPSATRQRIDHPCPRSSSRPRFVHDEHITGQAAFRSSSPPLYDARVKTKSRSAQLAWQTIGFSERATFTTPDVEQINADPAPTFNASG
jgi:hypothetical protein